MSPLSTHCISHLPLHPDNFLCPPKKAIPVHPFLGQRSWFRQIGSFLEARFIIMDPLPGFRFFYYHIAKDVIAEECYKPYSSTMKHTHMKFLSNHSEVPRLDVNPQNNIQRIRDMSRRRERWGGSNAFRNLLGCKFALAPECCICRMSHTWFILHIFTYTAYHPFFSVVWNENLVKLG